MPVAGTEIPFQYEFTADADTARRLAGSFLRASLQTPPVILAHVWLFVAFGALACFSPTASSGFWMRLITAYVGGSIGMILLFPFMAGILYSSGKSLVRQHLPEGQLLRTGFASHAYAVSSATGVAEVRFDTIRSVTARGGLVFVKVHGTRQAAVYPDALFPRSMVERVERAIAERRERPVEWIEST